jgi:uncharacterized integral membrane protein (TIGR00697 family)
MTLIFDARLKLFLFLTGLFITCLLVGDLLGGKITELPFVDLPITAGLIAFPVVFLVTDLLNEFYGKRAARVVTMVGFVMALLSVGLIQASVGAPWAGFTQSPEWAGTNTSSYNNVFGGAQRILLASVAAYLVAQLLDISVFHFIKSRTKNRFLWLRATGSTVVAQLIDTVIVQFLAFYGLPGMTVSKLWVMVGTGYVAKVLIALVLTPLIYAGHSAVERGLKLHPVVLGADGEPVAEPAQASRAA